jgi:hypothetical protein
MSTETLFANLPNSVRELVVQSSNSDHLGESEADKKDVASWIAKAGDTNFVSLSSLPVYSTLHSWNVATHGFLLI